VLSVMTTYETTECTIPSVFVFNVPPRQASVGHRYAGMHACMRAAMQQALGMRATDRAADPFPLPPVLLLVLQRCGLAEGPHVVRSFAIGQFGR
jgi:hypothetical protein